MQRQQQGGFVRQLSSGVDQGRNAPLYGLLTGAQAFDTTNDL
jgi:hypothetical protein